MDPTNPAHVGFERAFNEVKRERDDARRRLAEAEALLRRHLALQPADTREGCRCACCDTRAFLEASAPTAEPPRDNIASAAAPASHECPSCDLDDSVKVPPGKLLKSTPIKRPPVPAQPAVLDSVGCAKCGQVRRSVNPETFVCRFCLDMEPASPTSEGGSAGVCDFCGSEGETREIPGQRGIAGLVACANCSEPSPASPEGGRR